MSIVVNVIGKTWSIIASDGRAMVDGKVVTENYRKFSEINSRIICGYVGIKEFGETALALLSSRYDTERMTVRAVAEAILNIANEGRSITHTVSQFVITGKNEDGCVEAYTIKDCENISKYAVTASDEITYIVLGGDKANLDFTPYISPCANPLRRNISNIKNAITRYIKDVSRSDITVNRNIFFSAI